MEILKKNQNFNTLYHKMTASDDIFLHVLYFLNV